MEVSQEVVCVNGPHHGSADVEMIHELGFDREGLSVVVPDPVRSVV